MDNFNMKQWLQENKVGPYTKTLLSEKITGVRTDKIDLYDDITFLHNGEEYNIDVEVPFAFKESGEDIIVVEMTPKILELYVLEGGQFVLVTDESKIQEVEAAINANTDQANNIKKDLENFIVDFIHDHYERYDDEEEDRYEPGMYDEASVVPFVSKVHKSDPEQEF